LKPYNLRVIALSAIEIFLESSQHGVRSIGVVDSLKL
jgi:hypothetical protein